VLVVVPNWADDISDRTIGFRKKSRRHIRRTTVAKTPASAVQYRIIGDGRSGALAAKVPI
jgi:hypothetical protein